MNAINSLAIAILITSAGEDFGESSYRCGVHAVYCLIHLTTTLQPTIASIDQQLDQHGDGKNSMGELAAVVERLDAYPLAIYSAQRDLRRLPVPSIVHLKTSRGNHTDEHFSVVVRVDGNDSITLADAPTYGLRISCDQFVSEWSGHALAIFPTEDERGIFQSEQVRRQQAYAWSFRGGIVIAGVAACSLLWSVHSRGSRRSLRASLCAGVLILPSCSPSVMSPLVVETNDIDAGLVPPHGTTLEIPITNRGAEDILVASIITSCGCTKLHAPTRIRGRTTELLILDLEGSRNPVTRRSLVTIKGDNRPPLLLNVSYATGILPATVPERVTVSQTATKLPYGRFAVWFYISDTPSTVVFQRNCGITDDWQVQVLDTGAIRTSTSDRIHFSQKGLQLVRLSLNATRPCEDMQNEVTLAVTHDGKSIDLPLSIRVEDAFRLTVNPERLVVRMDQRPHEFQQRTIVVHAPATGECRIVEPANSAFASVSMLGTGCWRLDIDTNQVPNNAANPFELELEWSDGVNHARTRAMIEMLTD